jgi:hypothetical protein
MPPLHHHSWVQEMARGSRPEEAGSSAGASAAAATGTEGEGATASGGGGGIALQHVGEEWSTREELLQVVQDFIMVSERFLPVGLSPHVMHHVHLAKLSSASRHAPHCVC